MPSEGKIVSGAAGFACLDRGDQGAGGTDAVEKNETTFHEQL